jgi:hypothetical protein
VEWVGVSKPAPGSVREGEEMIECFEPAYDQLCEDPEYDKLSRTPLEIVPNGVIGKLFRDLGYVDSTTS